MTQPAPKGIQLVKKKPSTLSGAFYDRCSGSDLAFRDMNLQFPLASVLQVLYQHSYPILEQNLSTCFAGRRSLPLTGCRAIPELDSSPLYRQSTCRAVPYKQHLGDLSCIALGSMKFNISQSKWARAIKSPRFEAWGQQTL